MPEAQLLEPLLAHNVMGLEGATSAADRTDPLVLRLGVKTTRR